MCKILERLTDDAILLHLPRYNYANDNQYAGLFLRKLQSQPNSLPSRIQIFLSLLIDNKYRIDMLFINILNLFTLQIIVCFLQNQKLCTLYKFEKMDNEFSESPFNESQSFCEVLIRSAHLQWKTTSLHSGSSTLPLLPFLFLQMMCS